MLRQVLLHHGEWLILDQDDPLTGEEVKGGHGAEVIQLDPLEVAHIASLEPSWIEVTPLLLPFLDRTSRSECQDPYLSLLQRPVQYR